MLNKLVGLLQGGEKSSHPLGSEENLGQILGEIPLSDPTRVLLDIDHWIEDIGRYDGELAPAVIRRAVLRLETVAHQSYNELLQAWLLPGSRHSQSELAWSTLEQHCRLVFSAYTHCLDMAARSGEDLSKEKMQLALCATRAMQAWVERKKLLHFRYRPPDEEWWSAAHKLVNLAAAHGVVGLVQPTYPGETDNRSAVHAYLAGLYLEIAPVSNLVAMQLEVLHRWLRQYSMMFEFSEAPQAGTTHYIDLPANAGPQRYKRGDHTHKPGMRYASTMKLRPPLLQLAAYARHTEAPPDWLAPFVRNEETLKGLVQTLMQHWAEAPPERASPRQAGQMSMKVVQGFSLTRRMIACATYAKSGRSLNYRGADMENLFNELRFGRTTQLAGGALDKVDAPEEEVSPLEVLQRLETSGDKQMMEEWLRVDSSATGLGAVVPGLRSRNRIGELVGFRFEGEIEWRIGVIRRIGRDRQKRASIGLETLPWPSKSAQIRSHKMPQGNVWLETSESGNGLIDAMLVSEDGDTLIVPEGLYEDNLGVTLIVGGKQHLISMTRKIDHGSDWERVQFSYRDPAPQE